MKEGNPSVNQMKILGKLARFLGRGFGLLVFSLPSKKDFRPPTAASETPSSGREISTPPLGQTEITIYLSTGIQ